MTEELTGWRDRLKPGDMVIVSKNQSVIITLVERLTATQIITKSKHKFHRVSGNEVGRIETWFHASIEYPDPQRIEKIRADVYRRRLLVAIRNRYEKATTGALEQVIAILDTDAKGA